MIWSHWKTLEIWVTWSNLQFLYYSDIQVRRRFCRGILPMLQWEMIRTCTWTFHPKWASPLFLHSPCFCIPSRLCTAKPHFSCIDSKWWQSLSIHLMLGELSEPDTWTKMREFILLTWRVFHSSDWNAFYRFGNAVLDLVAWHSFQS